MLPPSEKARPRAVKNQNNLIKGKSENIRIYQITMQCFVTYTTIK